MEVKTKGINVCFVLLVAIIQFPIKLTVNLIYLSYVVTYGIPAVFLLFNINTLLKMISRYRTAQIQIFKLIYIYLFFISLIWPLVYQTYDYTYITKYWLGLALWILKYTFLTVFYEKYFNNGNGLELFAEYFILGASVYSVTSIISSLVVPVRQLMMKVIYLSPQDLLNFQRDEYYTRFGWTGWSSFNETAVCTFAVILACIVIFTNNGNKQKEKKFMLLTIFPMIGNAMFGRIGLLTSLICITYTCFIVIFKGDFRYLIRLIVILIIAIIVFNVFVSKSKTLQEWSQWVFSAFDNYRRYGKFYDNIGTVQHLTTDMYFMPKIDTFLFGDARYTDSSGTYYMQTDSGIMRPILYYGIFNYVLSVIGVILLIVSFAKKSSENIGFKNINIITILLIICVGIFEFKGESLWMFISLIGPISLINNNLYGTSLEND